MPAAPRSSPTAAPPEVARMSTRERWMLTVLMSATFMLAVDFSVLNVALPRIRDDLGFELHNLQWVITAFALPAAGLGLFFGRLGDLIGRRSLFITAMVLLSVGSALGAVAEEQWILILARVIQGIATAAAAPTALALLTSTFREGPLRARALGINGALLSAGFATGALLGGALTSGISWRAAFWINVPVALCVLVLVPFLFAESRPEHRPRLDLPGAITISLGLSALVFGISRASEDGFADAGVVIWLLVGAVFIGIFAWVESTSQHPLVPVRVLKRRTVLLGNVAGLTTFAMMSSFTYLATLYLQLALDLDPIYTGVVIAIIGIVAIMGALVVPRLIGRFGQVSVLVTSLVIQGLGTLIVGFSGAHAFSLATICVGLAVAALGHIGSIIGYTVTATSGLPNNEQGLATGLASTSQQIALALGTPVLATILAVLSFAEDAPASEFSANALSGTILVNGIVCILVSLVLFALFTRRPAGSSRSL